MAQVPEGIEVEREMTIRLDARNRPEPDLLLTTLPSREERTWFSPVHELDRPTGTYVATGIFRGTLKTPVPFDIDLDLDALTPAPLDPPAP